MADPDDHLALLRLSGEVSTKARMTRHQFVTRLVRNLKDALAAHGGGEVDRRRDRIFATAARPEGVEALARVFGVQSVARVQRRPATSIEQVVDAGAGLFAEAVRGKRFAVRARMVGERERRPFRARDVERELGTRLLSASSGVDLSNPEVTARVDVYQRQAYFFTHEQRGPAGLPLGTESRAIALVSGGFDSPVAAWQMLRRGVALDYVFCNLGGATHQLGTLRVMKVLADRWSYGLHPRLHAIDFAAVARELQARTEPRLWQVLLKRLMLRAADAVARETGGQALVTGDAVGQVSSQTLQNLAVISDAVQLPILRPLVGMNKDEIIALARHVGTEPLSAVVEEYCALHGSRPATAAKLEAVLEQEAAMDPALLAHAIESRERIDLRALDADDSGLPGIEVDDLPADAILLDLRSRAEFASWHHPDSVQLDFAHALEAFPAFDKTSAYVLSCEYGLKSAHLAELMQRAGFRAWHLRGGTRRLRQLA